MPADKFLCFDYRIVEDATFPVEEAFYVKYAVEYAADGKIPVAHVGLKSFKKLSSGNENKISLCGRQEIFHVGDNLEYLLCSDT